MKANAIDTHDVQGALREVSELCQLEYGLAVEQLLEDRSALAEARLQRIVGVLLKKKFAVAGPVAYGSATQARRSWPWADDDPKVDATNAEELALLEELRKGGPWNLGMPTSNGDGKIAWQQFKADVENERGLFKVLALYVADKLRGRDVRAVRDYLDAEESRRFEAGMDLATVVLGAAVLEPLAAIVGVPSVAVALALIAVQYGFRSFTDPGTGGGGDRES